ncbi:MAG: hypothetical protein RSF34_17745 [Flavobacterium sp.]|uniref:hypothetical protein n=1 Tax=Flavobacterium sp. TaxID=239 RepID=UPI002FC5D93D
MRVFNLLSAAFLFAAATSCTLDKTDYEAEISTEVTEYYEFKEAVAINSGSYKISIEALNGTFYKGYNEIRLKVTNTQTNESLKNIAVSFLPIKTNSDGNKISCPHQYNLTYQNDKNYYSGYSVFTAESNPSSEWQLYIKFTDSAEKISINTTIQVKQQSNKNLNMTSFVGSDNSEYIIALIAPQKPKVAENELVTGIYRYVEPTNPIGNFPDPSQFIFEEVSGYILQLDPRMPEPSMGNHSSPNNRDLVQLNDKFYRGIVNYTMTGNWTLNFIMLNENSKIIKGTEVSKDFTPGVEGTKSELFIDILF